MKLYQRLTSAGLSLLLAIGLTSPALAAEKTLEKEETVYVMLEPDGSLRSQTVSVHLHRDEGFSGVTDRSELSDIENVQGGTELSQKGEELTWNTAESDVYYKGAPNKTPPVSAEISYALDGKTAPLEELLGKSGRLSITVSLSNHETGTMELEDGTRQICTPFVTMVGAILDENWENIAAPHGIVKNLGKTQAAGFVCLPGVRESLEGLLPEELAEAEDYLQDQVTIEADVKELTAPSVFLVCGTDAQALKEEGFSGLDSLEGLEDLQEGMDALDQGMAELLDGAGRLAQGAQALNDGAAELVSGTSQLAQGGAQLSDGAISLRDGAQQLSSGAASARDGAQQLQSGANDLAGGLYNLQSGAGALSEGFYQLKSGSEGLVAGLQTLKGSSSALIEGIQPLSEGVNNLAAAAGPEGQLAAGAQAFGSALNGAAAEGSQAVAQLPVPETFSAMLADAGLPPEQQGQILAAYSGAYCSASSMAGGLEQLNSSYEQVNGAVQQVGAGVQALQEGMNGVSGLATGLTAYTQGVESAYAGATQIDAGLGQMGAKIPELTGGVAQLVEGSNQLSAGAGSLSQGNAALAEGAQQLAPGSEALANGAVQLTEGIHTLAAGAQSLQAGTAELASGANDLQSGLQRYNDEGISQLTNSLDPEQLSSLKSVLEAMRKRQEDFGSYAGAPEEAKVTTRFFMKTVETADPLSTAEVAEDSAGSEEEPFWQRFWQRLVDLFH